MFILKAEKREVHSKGKRLRKQGIIPAVLYGKHLDESMLIQIPQSDAGLFLKTNAEGTKLEIEIGGEKHMAMLKDITRTPAVFTVEHLSFLALKAGEKVKAVSQIVLHGKEKIKGVVLQPLNEISYRSLPSNMVDTTDINVEHLTVGENITVADIEFSKNPNIEILTPLDSVIVTVQERKEIIIEETTTDDESIETTEENDQNDTHQE